MPQSIVHSSNPLSAAEWNRLASVVSAVGNSTVARRFLPITGPLGAGVQTVPTDRLVAITEGSVGILGNHGRPVKIESRSSGIVPLLFKDFVIHWRDLEESRLTNKALSVAEAAAAAACCAQREDHLVFFGEKQHRYPGLMNVEGRIAVGGLRWDEPGDSFRNLAHMAERLAARGYNGPYAAVVHPYIYSRMHRVLKQSNLLEIEHIKSLCAAGVFKSSLLGSLSGLLVSTGQQNMELVLALDTSIAFLGANRLNLPIRVLKAVCLRISRSDAICSFEDHHTS